MNEFRVLVVDDDESQHEHIADLAEDIPGVVLFHAGDQEEAFDVIEREFLHLALVDLSLRGHANADTDGLFVLQTLSKVRPTCERLLLTTVRSESRWEAFRAFVPAFEGRGQPAQGLVEKLDEHVRARDLVRERAQRWLAARVDIHGEEEILDQLQRKRISGEELSVQRGPIAASHPELLYVLSRLFGQGEIDPSRPIDRVDSVTLHRLSEGWSRSVVAWCEPHASKTSRIGPRCVVKIGPRSDAEQEVLRYRTYVRYAMSLRHRVELLDHVLGDTLGAVCYSHGAARNTGERDLQLAFNESHDQALASIERLFDASEQHWFADLTIERDMAAFFKKEYGRGIGKLADEVHRFVQENDELRMSTDHRTARWFEMDFPIPSHEDLGDGRLRSKYRACVVHGDLHGGNVLLADDAQPVLIDYRNMARGPRALDFASLETSLRMCTPVCSRSRVDVMGDLPLERAAWEVTWNDRQRSSDDEPYWVTAALTIRRLARQNFPDLDEFEYASTCLLRALRVFPATAVENRHRWRLLVWMAVLVERMRRLAQRDA